MGKTSLIISVGLAGLLLILVGLLGFTRSGNLSSQAVDTRGSEFASEGQLAEPRSNRVVPDRTSKRPEATRPSDQLQSGRAATQAQAASVAVFASKIAPAAGVYAQSLAALNKLGAEAAQAPDLLRDQEWRSQTTFALKMIELAADDMASIRPVPMELKRTADLLQRINAETKPMVKDYARAVDAQDQQGIALASERLEKINSYLLEAAEEMRQTGLR